MNREYIKITKPSAIPDSNIQIKRLDDRFWKEWIFFHLLSFYHKHDKERLRKELIDEQTKNHPRVERRIAKFVRNHLNRYDPHFTTHGFLVFGEPTNDADVEGNYDIVIARSNWNRKFYFECKNLDKKQDLINKYVYVKTKHRTDGGVYRYFNGKYAQDQDFGGMIGFVLDGDILLIRDKIIKKLAEPFDTSPNGDLKKTVLNSIQSNDFTFDSIHTRKGRDFTIHHLLLKFSPTVQVSAD